MRSVTILFIASFLWLGPAVAEQRIALVVGNGGYSAVAPLDNPVNDAALIAATLENLAFEVTLLTDADQNALKRAISSFGRALRAGGPETVGLFYYAGHGVQSFGTNYLLPVDAELTDAADLDLVALEASSVLRQMASARNRTNIVILDACRNNPFEQIASLNDNGLAEMKAPTGTYLAYATAPGAVALDGDATNSAFTAALATEMTVEGAAIETVFKEVRKDVIEISNGVQTPWDTSSLTSNFVFNPATPLTAEQIAERQLWNSVSGTRDPVQIMLFLRTYPKGQFEQDARIMLSEVMQAELAPSAPAVETAPTPDADTDTEADLIEAARASGLASDYQAYLDAFPTGVFAELAKLEISAANARAAATAQAPVAEEKPTIPEVTDLAATTLPPVTFDVPLERGVPEIVGKTISEVVLSSPLFSPIEGIPDALWKGQQCANCHEWNRDALCTQANTYLSDNATRSLNKQHPFGGSFKQNLKSWAAGGCN